MEIKLKGGRILKGGSIVPGRNRDYKESVLLGLLAMVMCLGFVFISPFMFLVLGACFPILGLIGFVRLTPKAKQNIPAPIDGWEHGIDGCEWARAFAQKVKAEWLTDEGVLIGWFANAIMAGFDEARRRYERPTEKPRPSDAPVETSKESNSPIGEKVKWTSQAGGHEKTKEGVIVAEVPAGMRAQAVKEADPVLSCLSSDFGTTLPRDHLSYLVRVGNRLYWPRVATLQAL